MARDGRLTEEAHDALTGHIGGGSIGRGYRKSLGLKGLAQRMTGSAIKSEVLLIG